MGYHVVFMANLTYAGIGILQFQGQNRNLDIVKFLFLFLPETPGVKYQITAVG